MILYYKTPDMATGRTTGGDFSSSREIEEFMQAAPDAMPNNTLFYYRDRMNGEAWVFKRG